MLLTMKLENLSSDDLIDSDALLTIISIAANDLSHYARKVSCLRDSGALKKIGDVLMLIYEMRESIYVKAPFLRPEFGNSELSKDKLILRKIVENESFRSMEETISDYELLNKTISGEIGKFVSIRIKALRDADRE